MIFRTIAGDWSDSEMEEPPSLHHFLLLTPSRLSQLATCKEADGAGTELASPLVVGA